MTYQDSIWGQLDNQFDVIVQIMSYFSIVWSEFGAAIHGFVLITGYTSVPAAVHQQS
ncbi:hypothetical protein NEOLEDRAFT_1136843 [Neolentinus lepideus HHB14362 ss-1]|uniref:Uncharacterized protein n=1 Tax=Neolentinus lepideus HHB14362 ss-1 TaxID=1314782 RepID=A0A165R2L6_9AGAM|nr:hypothetical protein NEOLEDRAFT_1136843 [Neolentinus lepideus HHB14362 ss-1]